MSWKNGKGRRSDETDRNLEISPHSSSSFHCLSLFNYQNKYNVTAVRNDGYQTTCGLQQLQCSPEKCHERHRSVLDRQAWEAGLGRGLARPVRGYRAVDYVRHGARV